MLDFETRLFAKTNAADLLRETLARPGYRCESIALGAIPMPISRSNANCASRATCCRCCTIAIIRSV